MPLAAVIAVFTAVLGLAALVVLAANLFGQVRSLGRTVARSADRISMASAARDLDVRSADENP